ncbi:16S rRNA (guanine(527)-N(7))-methyltransferase RsmG [Helicobacter canis]|uniref:Ribosomal RNA small subunit methyltransferase G n=1 Tax=Helicobacter canis TaxID=29419 RepID=A0A377J6F0_9HELI|nr:16S rRNA (guanine(527)-N(7))-methyltransferase RsmG [Helicobacter canis]STO97864.1 16S rRNA methyltransferase [Helicobacter canis]
MLENAIDLTPYALDPRSFDTRALAHWLESTLATPNATAKAAQLELYAKTLLEWNTSHNLSGAHTMEDMFRQIVDSALPLRVIKPFSRCLDIGSGAGLPALVLGILRPESHFILCEPRKKRAAFLRIVGHKLGLRNLQVQATRIEHLALSYQADLITSRASLPNDIIFATTKPLLQPNGAYLLYKGERSYHIGLVDRDWAFGLESQSGFTKSVQPLESTFQQNSHSPTAKRSFFRKQGIPLAVRRCFFRKQATAVQGGGTQADFFSKKPTPKITLYRYNARIYVYKELAQCLD